MLSSHKKYFQNYDDIILLLGTETASPSKYPQRESCWYKKLNQGESGDITAGKHYKNT